MVPTVTLGLPLPALLPIPPHYLELPLHHIRYLRPFCHTPLLDQQFQNLILLVRPDFSFSHTDLSMNSQIILNLGEKAFKEFSSGV